MGAFSKELWITIAVSAPVILWTLFLAENRGNTIVPAFQVAVLIVGGVVIWRMGGQILEAVTKVWERIESTHIWDSGPQTGAQHEADKAQREAGPVEEYLPETRKQSIATHKVSDKSAQTSTAEGFPVVFCMHCGYTIRSNASFCRHCGKRQA
jgi:ribosomal protein L40E